MVAVFVVELEVFSLVSVRLFVVTEGGVGFGEQSVRLCHVFQTFVAYGQLCCAFQYVDYFVVLLVAEQERCLDGLGGKAVGQRLVGAHHVETVEIILAAVDIFGVLRCQFE